MIRVAAATLAACAAIASAQAPLNSLPNPYATTENWGQLPAGRTWGSTSAVEIDKDGRSIWVAERCGQNSCAGQSVPAVLKFDKDGKLLTSFGAGMFVFPHGIYVDKQGNVWVTDGQGRDGKGHQIFKFSPEGKVLLTLGQAGKAGATQDTFNQPSDVIVAPDGSIFVADGHGPRSNARIVKFDASGKYIKEWGKQGKGPGEFDCPHGLAFNSKGELLVADRGNNRIQIFDQEGKYLREWKQFSRPSGVYVDKKDVLYVTDSESTDKPGYGNNPGWKRGIRIGSAKDGSVKFYIPDPTPGTAVTSAAEGVAADSKGVVYGAEVGSKSVRRYVRGAAK
jgi:DNA-binding beta-propeller fold protein YncE